ncbi:XRE family transcriptional regulator [Mucilaginibacter limnophilus]|uniref:XRE family transcriptional regulator n=1 Tax=Mucilaginibacter limnophilus TaxID=1932778 RepID=A0A3S2UNZ6_9SPHI|nr:helix-turn-helix transcriptional regulator [Mucilaginibacter limnophilus]RVU02457.1 XRE family transcriptional regulator [Mucilaginibacter limnophilus]
MDKHYGQIVELIIRKKGYSISELARLTYVNRRSVYNWFNQKYLKPEIIHRIGCILDHDFSVEFPELFTKDDFEKTEKHIDSEISSNDTPPMVAWKDKYIELLERYNNLLSKKLQNET